MKQLIIEESCTVAFISEQYLQLLFLDSSIRQRVTMSQRSVIKSYKREEARQKKVNIFKNLLWHVKQNYRIFLLRRMFSEAHTGL